MHFLWSQLRALLVAPSVVEKPARGAPMRQLHVGPYSSVSPACLKKETLSAQLEVRCGVKSIPVPFAELKAEVCVNGACLPAVSLASASEEFFHATGLGKETVLQHLVFNVRRLPFELPLRISKIEGPLGALEVNTPFFSFEFDTPSVSVLRQAYFQQGETWFAELPGEAGGAHSGCKDGIVLWPYGGIYQQGDSLAHVEQLFCAVIYKNRTTKVEVVPASLLRQNGVTWEAGGNLQGRPVHFLRSPSLSSSFDRHTAEKDLLTAFEKAVRGITVQLEFFYKQGKKSFVYKMKDSRVEEGGDVTFIFQKGGEDG